MIENSPNLDFGCHLYALVKNLDLFRHITTNIKIQFLYKKWLLRLVLWGKDPSVSNICVKDKENVKIIMKFFLRGDYKSIGIDYYYQAIFGLWSISSIS